MKYGLRDAVLMQIIDVLKNFREIEKAVLYGSRAKGNYKEGSDIDIVFYGADITLSVINRVANDLDDLLLPYTFDLAVFEKINDRDIIDHIERVGMVIYERK